MTPAGAELADGLLADRYRLLRRIAVGGMGEVWRAEDVVLSREVAVKTLRSERSSDADRARLRAEARHAARLAHPGIASVYDFGETPERAWLVMELVDGEPLSDLLHREAPLDVDRTLDVVAQAAEALHAAHLGGVVHRDVKPGNLLLRPDGTLKVTDFGIASAVDSPSLTQTGFVVGTAYYLSPEQAAGRSGSPASDLYSLGVVAYECLTGERPFSGDSAVSLALAHLQQPAPDLPDSVPAAVRGFVARALSKRPEDRFPDAAAMAAAALALRTGAPRPAARPSSATGPARPPVAGPGPTDTALIPVGSGLADDAQVPTWSRSARVPGSGRRSARAAVTSTLVLLTALAGGAGLRSVLVDGRAPTAGTTVAEATARTVALDGLEGLPGEEVRSALLEQGLLPRLAYDGTGTTVGTVSRVDPGGDVAVGSEVVVHVVPTPEPVPSPAADQAPPVPAPVAVPAAPAAPAPAAPAATGTAGKGNSRGDNPGKGGGKGDGKGDGSKGGGSKDEGGG